MRGLLFVSFAVVMAAAALASDVPQKPVKPERAVGDFTSVNYPMTFKAPPDAYYCRLSEGWEGSDHGTTVFLKPPKTCYGAGYPSSSRGFEPGDVPRIDVYYGWDMREDGGKPPPCRPAGTADLFGKLVPLCSETRDGMTVIVATGYFSSGGAMEAIISLVARPGDVERHLPVFKALLATVHACTSIWVDDGPHGTKKKSTWGKGPPCPPGQWY
jgi:hypothetical protein